VAASMATRSCVKMQHVGPERHSQTDNFRRILREYHLANQSPQDLTLMPPPHQRVTPFTIRSKAPTKPSRSSGMKTRENTPASGRPDSTAGSPPRTALVLPSIHLLLVIRECNETGQPGRVLCPGGGGEKAHRYCPQETFPPGQDQRK
jgi:hypothetical protein